VSDARWQWNTSLYEGSASYYARGRVPYSRELVAALAAGLGLNGTGRLLDVGCGPGSLTLLLAPWFERATGLDADAGMLAEGARQADLAGIANVDWLHMRAEDISPDLGPFSVATLAQSFHWMDRPRVAELLHRLLMPGGALVHVHATTHEGVDSDRALPHPRPPRRTIEQLVRDFLGAGRSTTGHGNASSTAQTERDVGRVEAEIYRAAGFEGPTRTTVPGDVVVRTTDDVVASVFSLSSAAPHLFGGRASEFEAQLRRLLGETSPEGRFSEEMREIAADVWRR
jgi:SAM-dependent methyltransferase